jgi:hypothetical protein
MTTLRFLTACALALAFSASQASVPFWGDPQSQPVGTPPAALADGQWVWEAEAAPAGPIVVVVALDEQRTYVYRNGVLIGYASSSTGKPGYETPTGVFVTLQKDATHRSSTYNNAPMPYQQRLTWGGVALHAGGLPGFPSSHGCVHLPSAFAKALFEVSPMGMTVVVADEKTAPVAVARPLPVATVDAATGQPNIEPRLGGDVAFRWEPEKSPEGPLSLVLSRSDSRVLVFRNGVEIGRSRVTLTDDQPFGTHVFVAHGEPGKLPTWVALSVPGQEAIAGQALDPSEVARVRFPHGFLAAVQTAIVPGTTLVVTDAPVLPHTTGQEITIIANGPPHTEGG